MSEKQVAKIMGPAAMQQLLSMGDQFPLSMAMEILVIWQASNPTRFKSLAQQGILLPLLEQQAQAMILVTDLEADPQYQHLVRHEIMQMCQFPLTLSEALATSR